MRFLGFGLARFLNAVFFVGSCVYCLLSYSSFAYEQFIRPQLIGWLPEVVALHHQAFWLTVLVTLPTLLGPILRGTARQRAVTGIYLAGTVALGLWLTTNPVLAVTGPNTRTLVLAILCLVPPLALAIVDHVTAGQPGLRRIDGAQLFLGTAGASVAIWLAYVLLIPWYIPRTIGIDLSWAALAVAISISLATHLMVFALVYLIAAAAMSFAALSRRPQVEYWMLSALWVAAVAFVMQHVVADALSFQTAESWILSVWLSFVLVVIWSGLAWRRAASGPSTIAPDSGAPSGTSDALELWFSPIAGHRGLVVTGIVMLPLIALGLRTATAQFDWNFMIQKLGVSLVWGLTFGWASVATRRLAGRGRIARRTCDAMAAGMIAAGLVAVPLATRVVTWSSHANLEPEFVLDRYAVLDSSHQLLRSVLRTNAGADAQFYSYLKAHSTLGRVTVKPVAIDFVDEFRPAIAPPPHVFLFIVDSLRADYLAPYNPAVTFTPATQAFAADAVVFERAFTRYGGTALSVPALWVGGMLLHKQFVLPFAPMHSLEKLLDGAGYRRFMSDDHLIDLFRASPATTLLDESIQEMDHTMCATVRELQSKIDLTAGDHRPIFAMTRPLQLHLARLPRDPATPASAYPGFVPGYAAQVAAFDRCLGEFIHYLKRTGLYDRSVMVLTSDHGESLGEDGRWGHAYTLYPEVVRIPLIMRLPPSLAATLTTDRARVALSSDVTPTLYALAGHQPRRLGDLYGEPLFTPVGQPIPDRRRQSFLLSSSYGPVHAMLRHNGRSLYIADAIGGTDAAYEMRADNRMERLTLTDAARAVNRGLIRDHLGRIAAQYRFSPEP